MQLIEWWMMKNKLQNIEDCSKKLEIEKTWSKICIVEEYDYKLHTIV
jgi:hypothetical protein